MGSSVGSSVRSITPLGLSLDDLPAQSTEPPQPRSASVAPSDNTPRPPEQEPPLVSPPARSAKSGPTKQLLRKTYRRPQNRKRPALPWFVWVAFAISGVAILALMIWLIANPQ
jgi:hypothetical protein